MRFVIKVKNYELLCCIQDRNRLETYEEISSEQNDVDIFANLTFRFTCEDMPSGFYADVDYNCRIFHVCENSGDGFPVICANDTVFDQKQRICTDQESIDCQHAHEWCVYLTTFRLIEDFSKI